MAPRKVRPLPPTKVAHARISNATGYRTIVLMRFRHESYEVTTNLHDGTSAKLETVNVSFRRRSDAVLAWMDACAIELTDLDDGN